MTANHNIIGGLAFVLAWVLANAVGQVWEGLL